MIGSRSFESFIGRIIFIGRFAEASNESDFINTTMVFRYSDISLPFLWKTFKYFGEFVQIEFGITFLFIR